MKLPTTGIEGKDRRRDHAVASERQAGPIIRCWEGPAGVTDRVSFAYDCRSGRDDVVPV